MPLEPQQFPATTVPTRFIGGRITTEDPAKPEADALVTDATGRIAWIGWANKLPAAFAGDAYKEVDLGGARVIPGFVDAHMHAVMLANFAPQISVLPPNITSIAELTEAIRARRAAQGPNAWVEGWGYDEALLAETSTEVVVVEKPRRTRMHHAHLRTYPLRQQPCARDRWHHARHARSCWRRNRARCHR